MFDCCESVTIKNQHTVDWFNNHIFVDSFLFFCYYSRILLRLFALVTLLYFFVRLFNFEKKSNNTNSFRKTRGIVPPNKKCNTACFIKQ